MKKGFMLLAISGLIFATSSVSFAGTNSSPGKKESSIEKNYFGASAFVPSVSFGIREGCDLQNIDKATERDVFSIEATKEVIAAKNVSNPFAPALRRLRWRTYNGGYYIRHPRVYSHWKRFWPPNKTPRS